MDEKTKKIIDKCKVQVNKCMPQVDKYIAQESVKSAETILDSAGVSQIQDTLIQALKNEINHYDKKQLAEVELNLSHYTSVETIYSILADHKENESGLRLYDALDLNDPNEGKYLKDKLAENHTWLNSADNDTDAFICSFVGGEEKIEDKLMYWQSYGENGLGCSIKITPPSSKKAIYERVFYGINGINDVKNQFKEYFELGDWLCKLYDKTSSEEIKNAFSTKFWKAFEKKKFLHKDDAYKDEHEYRRIVVPDSEKEIKYHFKSEGPYLRRYIIDSELNADKILTSGSTVVIGPRVKDSDRLCKNLKRLAVLPISPTFIGSKIPYRKIW